MPCPLPESKTVASIRAMTRKKPEKRKKKPQRATRDYINFLVIGVVLIFIADAFLWGGERPYVTKLKEQYYKEKQQERNDMEALLPPVVVYPEDGSDYFEAGADTEVSDSSMVPERQFNPEEAVPDGKTPPVEETPEAGETREVPETREAPDTPETPETYEVPETPEVDDTPKEWSKDKISIVIDDVGMNLVESNRAIDLPSEVTLAFLPYAETVRELSAKATGEGHEIIIHTPMEAMSSKVSLGPMALKVNMDSAAFDQEFSKIAASFDGYVGVNNHMGSRLTQDPVAMGHLMNQLKQRGLYFLDSRTISTSVAADIARTYGVPYAERDVFLDHEETIEFTANALRELEQVARRNGRAIAIGHPKKITMDALQKWIPTLEKRGFELVSLSELIKKPDPNFKMAMETQKIAPAAAETANEISPLAGFNYGLPADDFYKPQIEIMNAAPLELRSTPSQ